MPLLCYVGEVNMTSVNMSTPLETAYEEGRQAARLGAAESTMRQVWILESARAWKQGYEDFFTDQAQDIDREEGRV